MECFWLWAPFKQLQYLWKNNLTNFIEICKSPEVGPTSFSGLLPLVSGVLLLYLTHLLDPVCISPVTSSHANTILRLLLSCDPPKSRASNKNHFWPRYQILSWKKRLSFWNFGFRNYWCTAWNMCTSSLLKMQPSWLHKGRVCTCYRS